MTRTRIRHINYADWRHCRPLMLPRAQGPAYNTACVTTFSMEGSTLTTFQLKSDAKIRKEISEGRICFHIACHKKEL